MSRQAGSIFRGIQSRAGYPSNGPAAGGRYVLRAGSKVKAAGNGRAGNGPSAKAPRPLLCLVMAVTSATAATVTAAAVTAATATTVTAAVTTAAGTSPAGAATWGPTRARPPDRAADYRTSGVASSNVAMTAVPAMPSHAAAPAEAAAPGITAPIEARTAPATVVPAVISSAIEELSLFDLTGNGSRREAVDRQGVGLANRTHQGKGNRSCGRVDPMSHEGVSVLFCESRAAPHRRAGSRLILPCPEWIGWNQQLGGGRGGRVARLSSATGFAGSKGPSKHWKKSRPLFVKSIVRAFDRDEKSSVSAAASC